jgi:SAM-dependent methyltransferase
MRHDAETVGEGKRAIVAAFGPWTTPIDLGFGINACDAEDPSRGTRLRRLVQIVQDLAGGRLEALRVLDLGCLEGMVSVELARRGARVVGIEAREANVAKARFAKETLELDNLEIIQDDVRNLSRARHGSFDLVLCLGILYHLPAPDVFDLAERMAEVTEHAAIVDTHIALREAPRKLFGAPTSFEHRGAVYCGRPYHEFEPGSLEGDRLKCVWSSIDARPSFWPTRASLLNLLSAAGFTSLHESRSPRWIGMAEDRITLVAFRGATTAPASAPLEPWPEEPG